jgi:hypothetical protein
MLNGLEDRNETQNGENLKSNIIIYEVLCVIQI